MAEGAKQSYQRRGYSSLADIAQNPEQLRMIRAAAGHPDVVSGIRSEEEAQAAIANIRQVNRKIETAGRKAGETEFTRGRILRHKPTGRKVTIIRASAGRKDGEKLHEVVDQHGKKFLARESNLKSV